MIIVLRPPVSSCFMLKGSLLQKTGSPFYLINPVWAGNYNDSCSQSRCAAKEISVTGTDNEKAPCSPLWLCRAGQAIDYSSVGGNWFLRPGEWGGWICSTKRGAAQIQQWRDSWTLMASDLAKEVSKTLCWALTKVNHPSTSLLLLLRKIF